MHTPLRLAVFTVAIGALAGCVTMPPSISGTMARYDPSRAPAGPTPEQLAAGPSQEWRDMSPACQQLLMRMAPYAQQARQNMAPVYGSMQELGARADARMAAAVPEAMAMTAAQTAASAASITPAGAIAGKAVAMAAMEAQAAQFQAAAAADAPLAAQARAQMNQFVDQSQQMRPDLERIMAEGQANHCF